MLTKMKEGQPIPLARGEAKAFIMKVHGFKTDAEYNKYYDISRNKLRAYERYMKSKGSPIQEQSVLEFLYKEARAMKREGANYTPSARMQTIKGFSSISSGKAGTKALQGQRYQNRASQLITNETYRKFKGLIDANDKARALYEALIDEPVKQLQTMIDFATRMHAELGTDKGEAIFSGEVYGSDSYDTTEFDYLLE